ncbi:unnamed protein product, partial [Polarella glacialis]
LMASFVRRFLGNLTLIWHGCRRLCLCVQGSPLACLVITPTVLILMSLILLFNICLARLLTKPGALVFNMIVFWLLLRLVVRVLVFPGSILLWRRSTEASYKAEMSKQFSHHLEQLYGFMAEATGKSAPKGPA